MQSSGNIIIFRKVFTVSSYPKEHERRSEPPEPTGKGRHQGRIWMMHNNLNFLKCFGQRMKINQFLKLHGQRFHASQSIAQNHQAQNHQSLRRTLWTKSLKKTQPHSTKTNCPFRKGWFFQLDSFSCSGSFDSAAIYIHCFPTDCLLLASN